MDIAKRLREIAASKLAAANDQHAECSRLVEGFIKGDPIDTERYVEAYKQAAAYSEEYMTAMLSALQLELESDVIHNNKN